MIAGDSPLGGGQQGGGWLRGPGHHRGQEARQGAGAECGGQEGRPWGLHLRPGAGGRGRGRGSAMSGRDCSGISEPHQIQLKLSIKL